MITRLLRSKLTQNASWLMILQLSSYAVPFLLLPYLTRTLGLHAFGELAVAWAVAAYIQIFADFGFYLWGVRECALHRHDNERISKLYSNIQTIKIFLLFISLIIMLAVSKIAGSSVYLYLFLWFAVVGQALMPGWLYQGMERNFWFLVFNICAQVVAAIITVILVSSPSDLIFVTFSAGLSWILFSLAANLDVKKRFALILKKPETASLKESASGAYPLFSANIWVALYVNLPAVAVGFLSAKSEAATFVGAQKIILAVQALFTPISSALFPRMSALASGDKATALAFFKKIATVSLSFMLAVSLSLYALSDFIIHLALGVQFAASAEILRIMSFGVLLVVANMLLANHYIVALGYAKKLKNVYLISAVVAVFLSVVLVSLFDARGAAFVYLFTEIIVFAGLLRLASKIPSS